MRRTRISASSSYVLAAAVLSGCGTIIAGMIVPDVASAQAWRRPAAPPAYTTTAGTLSAVTATSAGNAWAVGAGSDNTALIVHWNGRAWTRTTGPALRGAAILGDVAASSASNVWAVGAIGNRTLILHFNGSRWSRVPSPSPSGLAGLTSVTVTGSGAAWAVGVYYPQSVPSGLILHWAGGKWRQQSLPAPGDPALDGATLLTGVSARSARRAWAVGFGDPGFSTTFAQWQGSHWRVAASPDIDGGGLSAVAMAPRGQAWAVGRAGSAPLLMRYSGSSWRRVHSPAVGKGEAVLTSVTVLRDGTAWAVGSAGERALTLRWNGRAWRSVPAPSFSVAGSSGDLLSGVAAYPGGAWAVGYTDGGDGFILRWNGSTW